MLFSLTKEIGWEADDEDEDPKPSAGVLKRYRFILDFSRRRSKTKDKNSKQAADVSEAEVLEDYSDCEGDDDDINVEAHTCFACGHIRSDRYHQQHSLRSGKIPRDNLCSQCRHHRKVRLALRARDGGRRHRVSHSEARIDHREWCTRCGILRSTKYHDKLLSGKSVPLTELCRYCTKNEVKRNNRETVQMYFEELDVEEWDKTEKHDPLRDSLQHRRSSPYAITPTSPSFREEVIIVPTATSASDLTAEIDEPNDHRGSPQQRRSSPYAFTPTSSSFREEVRSVSTATSRSNLTTKTNQSSNSARDKQVPVTATVSEKEPTAPSVSNVSGRSHVRPTTKKDTVKSDVLENNHKSVRTDCQKSRDSPQAQQQEKSRLPDEHLKRRQRRENPTPAPNCITADNTQQRQEPRESHRPPHGHRRGLSNFSTRSCQPETQEPFYFRNSQPVLKAEKPSDAHNRYSEPKVAEHFYFRYSHPVPKAEKLSHCQNRQAEEKVAEQFYFRNSAPTSKAQQKEKVQQQQQQQQQQQKDSQKSRPQPKPMGIADMYWASEKGRAEQTSTAGGFFFPGGAFASTSSSRYQKETEAKHRSRDSDPASSADPSHPFGHASRASSTGHSGSSATSHGSSTGTSTSTGTNTSTGTGTSTSRAWEVDSDEAEEIELSHAKLVAAQSERRAGKAGKA